MVGLSTVMITVTCGCFSHREAQPRACVTAACWAAFCVCPGAACGGAVPACVHCAGTAPCARRSSSSTPSGRTPWLESAHPEDAGLRLVPGARAPQHLICIAPGGGLSMGNVALKRLSRGSVFLMVATPVLIQCVWKVASAPLRRACVASWRAFVCS